MNLENGRQFGVHVFTVSGITSVEYFKRLMAAGVETHGSAVLTPFGDRLHELNASRGFIADHDVAVYILPHETPNSDLDAIERFCKGDFAEWL